MSGIPGLLLPLLLSAQPGDPRIDPAALLPRDEIVYFRERHPARSCVSASQFSPGSELGAAMEEFNSVLEIAVGWELGIPAEEMEKVRDRVWLQGAFPLPEGGSPLQTDFDLVVQGIPPERLRRLPPDEPRTFFGEVAFAIHGDLLLFSSRRTRLEAMLRRARGELSPSLLEEATFRRVREMVGEDSEFFFAPRSTIAAYFRAIFSAVEADDPARREQVVRKLLPLVDFFGGLLVTVRREPGSPGERETDFRLLLDPTHPLAPLYDALRQEGGAPTLPHRIPPNASLAAGMRLDLPGLLRRLRALPAPGAAGADEPAAETMRDLVGSLASLTPGPEVEEDLAWVESVFEGEVALFTTQPLPMLFGPRVDRRAWGIALRLRSPDRFASIAERLVKRGFPAEEVEDGLLKTGLPGLPPVFFSRDGDAAIGGFAPETIRAMKEARASGHGLAEDELFRKLLPPGGSRSKWFYLRVEAMQALLRAFAPGLAHLGKPIDRLALGLETREERDALRFWIGISPVSYFELFTPESAAPTNLAGRTRTFAGPEEKALASLLALREAEEEFRARGIRDRDGDGLPEYGTLADLAAASLLPRGLALAAGSAEAEATSYLFRADVPFETDLGERLWAGYAWPREYGTTGVNAFWVRPNGLPRRMVNAAFSGPGKGPKPESALLAPMPANMPRVDDYLWTPVGK